jgi:hypothetical protein
MMYFSTVLVGCLQPRLVVGPPPALLAFVQSIAKGSASSAPALRSAFSSWGKCPKKNYRYPLVIKCVNMCHLKIPDRWRLHWGKHRTKWGIGHCDVWLPEGIGDIISAWENSGKPESQMKLQMILKWACPWSLFWLGPSWSQENWVPKFGKPIGYRDVSSSLRKLCQLSQAGTVASIQITLECISTTAMGRLTIGVGPKGDHPYVFCQRIQSWCQQY